MGAFVLEPEDGDADIVEQGGAVDLVLQPGDFHLLDGTGHGAIGGELSAHADIVEGAEPRIGAGVTGRRPGRRVEVPPEVEVGPGERVSD